MAWIDAAAMARSTVGVGALLALELLTLSLPTTDEPTLAEPQSPGGPRQSSA